MFRKQLDISQIIQIPSSIQEISLKRTIKCGGLINCIPAELFFDFNTASVRQRTTKSWSTNASDKFGDILKSCLAIEFTKIHSHCIGFSMNEHYFGHLMIQLANGMWHNAVKALINLKEALLPDNDDIQWVYILNECDSICQKIWENAIVGESEDVGETDDTNLN